MEFDASRPEVAFAIDVTRQAALLARTVQSELVEPALSKDDRSPVTVADFAVQALVSYLLGQSGHEDPLVGEEDAAALRAADGAATLERVVAFVGRTLYEAGPESVCKWIDDGKGEPGRRFWVLDPVDGTKGFLRGDQYVVALALVEDGEVRIGVLGCPHITDASTPEVGGEGSLVVAVRGEGTWTTPLAKDGAFRQLHVSDVKDPAEARLLRSFESGHTNVSQIDAVAQALGTAAEPVRMDSQAKYAILASGQGDLLFRLLSPKQPDYREKIWDQAAGSLVVEEAGGRITDLSGKGLDFTAGRTLANNRGVLASNTHLHDAALDALRDVGA